MDAARGFLGEWRTISLEGALFIRCKQMLDRAKDKGSARPPAAGSKEDQDQEKAYREFNAALSQAIGDVVRLMAMHKSYGHMFLTDIQWMLIPPIVARQYKMISNNKGGNDRMRSVG